MATFSDCPGCANGRHDQHVEHWGTRPEGVIDGDFCNCIGDCAERAERYFNKTFGPIFSKHLTVTALSPEAQALLRDLNSADTEVADRARQRLNELFEADPLPDKVCQWCGVRPATGHACTTDGAGEKEVDCCEECGAEFGWDYIANGGA